jgi:toxin YoeB
MNVARNWTGDLGTHIHQTSTKRCKNLASAGLKEKALKLLEVLKVDPYQTPPPYEKLIGDLAGAYSRRINIQHRLVYQVLEAEKHIKILRMWTHYE